MSRPAIMRMIEGATAPAISNVFVNNKCSVCTLQITGTFTSATVVVEGIVDVSSGAWTTLATFNLSDLSMRSDGMEEKSIYQVGIEGILRIRANVTAVSGGNITVVGHFVDATMASNAPLTPANEVPTTAYDIARAGGYTGTYEQFQTDMGNSATNATNAANSASSAETSATNAAAAATNFAPVFATNVAYSAGDYVLKDGVLYKFTANHAAGAWTGSDAVADKLAPEVADLKTQLNQRGIPSGGTTGQSLRKKSGTNYDMEWADVGLPTDEQTADAVSAWLDDHPEATTTVEDGSLTEAKFTDSLKLKTIKDYVTPQMYGAKGDGTTDDYTAIVNCINAAASQNKTVIFPKVSSGYFIGTTVIVTADVDILMESPLISNDSAIVIGSTSSNLNAHNYIIKARGNDVGTGIKFINVTASKIYVEASKYVNGVVFAGDTGGFAYNYVKLGSISNCEYCITLRGDNNGWCNENIFMSGRLHKYSGYNKSTTGVLIDSNDGYINNNNVFVKQSAENLTYGFVFNFSTSVLVLMCRTERTTTAFTFSQNSFDNRVIFGTGTKTVEDNGVDNTVIGIYEYASIAYNNLIYDSGFIPDYCFNNESEYSAGKFLCRPDHTNALFPINFERYNDHILASEQYSVGVFVDTNQCKQFKVTADCKDNTPHRWAVKMFDENGDEITDGIISSSRFGSMTYIISAISTNNGAFRTGTAATSDLYFGVPTACKKAYICIPHKAGASEVPAKIRRMRIFGTGSAEVIPSGLGTGLSSAPTCAGLEGDICPSSGTNTGWRYHNGAWESF